MREAFFRVATALGIKRLPEPIKRRLRPLVGLKNPSQRMRFMTIASDGNIDAVAEFILDKARTEHLPIFETRALTYGIRRINLPASAAYHFNQIVRTACAKFPNVRTVAGGNRKHNLKRDRPVPYDIMWVHHIEEGITKCAFASRLEVSFWNENATYNGSAKITPDRRNRDVFLSDKFDSLRRGFDLFSEISDKYESTWDVKFPIDAVITWVDDADEAWAAKKDEWLAKMDKPANALSRAHHSERFRNRDELRYCIRSIEMFAPFIRRIYLVTDNQRPGWLVENDKLKVVDHRKIFANPSVLPVFNSQAIETQLHHIEGLSEHFIYFNDDFFLGRLIDPSDFFFPNGIIKLRFSNNTIIPEVQPGDKEEYMAANARVISLFRERFGYSPRNVVDHVPCVLRRSFLYELENEFPDAFAVCASNKFRAETDITPTSFMLPHYAAYKAAAVTTSSDNRYLALWKPTIEQQLRNVLRQRKHKFLCINDVGLQEAREEEVGRLVANFLAEYFPIKSQFEKD